MYTIKNLVSDSIQYYGLARSIIFGTCWGLIIFLISINIILN